MSRRLSLPPSLLVVALLALGALHLAARSDARPPAPGGNALSLAPGVVTDDKDPEGRFRVRVRFPWLPKDDSQSVWARVVVPLAGPDRGFHALPEVGDEVICGFEHGDVKHPYVLGSVWNGR